MKYVSTDIETTGLDPSKHKVIEIAMVIDDLANPKPLYHLPKISWYIDNGGGELVWSDAALLMFKDRLQEYYEVCSNRAALQKEDVGYAMLEFLGFHLGDVFTRELGTPAAYSEFIKTNKVTFAGKNFAGFDKPFLSKITNGMIDMFVHHRVLDPGSMYTKVDDQFIPSIDECKKRANIPGVVSHRALEDALDVVRLVRYHFGITF